MSNRIVKIGNFEITNFGKPFIIAEIGSNHNGQFELAKKLIDKAVACGVHAVKFQSFDTTLFSEACYEGDLRRKDLMDNSPALKRFFTGVHPELKREMQEYMAPEQLLHSCKKYCDEKGVLFFCTPLDKRSADFCVDELGMKFIKVASMDLNNLPFLKYLAKKGKPIILSTGMGTFREILDAVDAITSTGNKDLIILHCVSIYPPKEKIINLNNLDMLRDMFDYPIGFSDHSFGTTIPIAAVAKGACVIEKHFTIDKNLPGWDHKISATPFEMMTIVEECDKVYRSLGGYHRTVTQEELDKRELFRRSVVVVKDVSSGHILREEDLDFKRPGNGIEPNQANLVIGRTLKNSLKYDDLVHWKDLV